jgi:hypothetical protein
MGWSFASSADRFADKVIDAIQRREQAPGTLAMINGGPPYLPAFVELPLGNVRHQIIDSLERRRGGLPGPAVDRLNEVIDAYRENLTRTPSKAVTPSTFIGTRG